MFVQVIQAKVSDKDEMRAAVDRWADELAPGATGWLGSTGGPGGKAGWAGEVTLR